MRLRRGEVRTETPDPLARAACLYEGRASAYELEAQASGSVKDPKRGARNARSTCSRCVLVWGCARSTCWRCVLVWGCARSTCWRCVLVWGMRQRVQARSASEWVRSGPKTRRPKTPDPLAGAACLWGRRASAHELEAQASGSAQDRKRGARKGPIHLLAQSSVNHQAPRTPQKEYRKLEFAPQASLGQHCDRGVPGSSFPHGAGQTDGDGNEQDQRQPGAQCGTDD